MTIQHADAREPKYDRGWTHEPVFWEHFARTPGASVAALDPLPKKRPQQYDPASTKPLRLPDGQHYRLLHGHPLVETVYWILVKGRLQMAKCCGQLSRSPLLAFYLPHQTSRRNNRP